MKKISLYLIFQLFIILIFSHSEFLTLAQPLGRNSGNIVMLTNNSGGYIYYETSLIRSWIEEGSAVWRSDDYHVLKGQTVSITISCTITVKSCCYTGGGEFITYKGGQCISVGGTISVRYSSPYCFYLTYHPKYKCEKYYVEKWWHDGETGEDTLIDSWYEYHKEWNHQGVWRSHAITGCPPDHSNYGRDYP